MKLFIEASFLRPLDDTPHQGLSFCTPFQLSSEYSDKAYKVVGASPSKPTRNELIPSA
jgi:hypothetical protein